MKTGLEIAEELAALSTEIRMYAFNKKHLDISSIIRNIAVDLDRYRYMIIGIESLPVEERDILPYPMVTERKGQMTRSWLTAEDDEESEQISL